MSSELYIAYLAACLAIVIVPGPTLTLIVANSLKHGSRAGLLNVAGTQLGLAVIITVVGVGLASAIEMMGHWFDWLRLAGAAYLVWLGWKMLRSSGAPETGTGATAPRGDFFIQGCLVALGNPKTLVFFGAFFPQFIDPSKDYTFQIVMMGATAMAFAAVSDSAFAIIAGRAGRMLSARRAMLLSRTSGGVLIGGGLWLAVTQTR